MSVSFDNVAEKTFDNFKKLTPALFAVSILTGSILFSPMTILERMSLNNLPDTWKRIIGMTFLLSVALIVTIILSPIFSAIAQKRKYRKFKENQREKLQKLSSKQMNIICELLESNDKAIRLERNSGDTTYLLTNLFIYQPDQAVSLGLDNKMILTYVPQPWLIELYNEEPYLFR